MGADRWFLHADLDAFFASVEQLDHPDYRGKPVIVGGLPTDPRSVVSTASYEARKYGVHSAMPTAKAYKLCPQGIYVHGNMKRYEEMSYQIMQIFRRFSPDVMQMSIDEAFINLTGTERLFGPPEETAMKIKQAVKEETGLTVSIGLASSKYFAKISSGLSKPDGFYFMKPGTETDFMLHQPVNKIWGIGNKTAKRIFDSGFKTTKQLYEKSLDVLTFMYGDSTGTFLYNILRGNADGMFEGDAKSHSISNERTFPFDVTDIYTNETALLELAHSVMFRLLRDNLSSRTVVIKIRYEDFTTVSIRQTYSNDILTLDSFYEKVKDLFEKKYERGRGVRLLGVGFDNVKEEQNAFQQELFDDGEKKKQAVEQAILKIEKKFPDIHIKKARTLKSIILAIFMFALSSKSLRAESPLLSTPFLGPLPGESPETLFNFDINDNNNVEFITSGFWNATLTENLLFSFNNDGSTSFAFGIPVFKQEVNFSAWVMLNKKWYLEAGFADEFKKNQIAFGYKDGKIIKSMLLSNRNIVYPSYYSSSLFGYNPGGGENQAPGFGMHIEHNKFFADFMVRYDMQKTQSATFYGYNSVTDVEIALSNYITGRFFVIPNGYVSKIKNVYVESAKGTLTDSSGRKFKKLSTAQYFILPSKSMLILTEDSLSSKNDGILPTVLITFGTSSDTDSIITSIGSYDDSTTYLGKIQDFFNTSQKIDLKNYSYGTTKDAMKTTIESETALIIQSPLGFSPFVNASNYDFGLQSNADVMIYSKSNESPVSKYLIEETKDALLFSEPDFFNEKHNYGTVFKKDLATSDFENDVSLRFPLADFLPMVYLNDSKQSDLVILRRMYSPSSNLQIDAGVSRGSVQVYKNGILDIGARYDSESGIITLSSPVSDTDKIYVTWAKESNDFFNGKITGAIGAGYQFLPELKGDLDVTTSWSVSPNITYSDTTENHTGYVALSSGIYYEKNNLKISDAINFALETENVTGSKIIFDRKESLPSITYLSQSSGYQTTVTPNFITPTATHVVPKSLTGVQDLGITGFKIPLELQFENLTDSVIWTSADIKLSNSSLLPNAKTFSIALQAYSLSDYKVYLQLGCYAGSENIKASEELLPTWELSLDATAPDGTWQFIDIDISEKDRARFSSYTDARIIVVSSNSLNRKNGTLFIGPYEITPISFDTYSSSGIDSSSSCEKDNSAPSRTQFSKTTSYVNKVSWTNTSSISDPEVRFGTFFAKTDISTYKSVKFYFKPKNITESSSSIEKTFTFILDSNSSSILEDGANSLKITLNGDFVTQNDDKYHLFEINIVENAVYIDGSKIPSDKYELYINSAVVPSAMKIIFDGYESGEFYFDTLYIDGNAPSLKMQNNITASYKSDKELLSKNGTKILSDFEAEATSRQAASINTASQNTAGLIQAFAKTGITVTKIRLELDASLTSSNKKIIDNAGHSIATTEPLFNIISFKENYRFNTVDNSTEKQNSFTLSGANFSVPLKLTGAANSKETNISKTQNSSIALSFDSKYFGANTGLKLNQKTNTINSHNENDYYQNYFSSYGTAILNQFSDGDANASLRHNQIDISLNGKIPFINMTPKISYAVNGDYKSASENLYNGTETFSIELPFTIKKQTVSFGWNKKGGKIDPIQKGGNYITDLQKSFQTVGDMDYFFSSFWFADLFDDNLSHKILNNNIEKNSQGSNYSSNYNFTWKHNMYNSVKDLFIPYSASFQVERNITATEKLTDMHQFKFNINNSFINLFGSNSKLKFFKWYLQDEFMSSITCAIKVPHHESENTTFNLSVYDQLIFYITDSSSLKTSVDFTIETTGNWNLRGGVIYSYPGKNSFIIAIINIFNKKKTDLNFKILRKDIFDMEINHKPDDSSQRYAITHNCDINFIKYITITTGIGLEFAHNDKKGNSLGINLSLGGSVTF